MILIQNGNTYNVPLKTFYVESEAEISEIPDNVPAGTLVEINAPTGFTVKMKDSTGAWREIY